MNAGVLQMCVPGLKIEKLKSPLSVLSRNASPSNAILTMIWIKYVFGPALLQRDFQNENLSRRLGLLTGLSLV